MKEREFVMIGLGVFGKKVNEDFKSLFADRRSLLAPAEQERIGIFQVDFPCDAPFDFDAYHEAIEGVVRNSHSRNNNLPFDFYLVGNLGEPGVAMQVVDIAYLLHVMDRSGILRIEDTERPGSVVSFLTYSDLLGSSKAYSEDQVSAFVWFLEQSRAVSRERNYQPEYADPNGKPFAAIHRQPFDRNYLFQTPGDEVTIMSQTARVFCERLFIEFMIIGPDYKYNIGMVQRNMFDVDAPFCSFCFYQVPRLADLQRYMLKFKFEEFCLDLSRGKPLTSSLEKSLWEKFRRLFDLEPGREGEFPAGRVAGIFQRRYASAFSGAIVPYVGGGDVGDYISRCEDNFRNVVAKLDDNLLTFLREEFGHIKQVFIEGTRSLFQAPALYGYFAYYLEFLEELRELVKGWAATDIVSDAEKDRKAFSDAFEATMEKLAVLEAKPILHFHLFAPLKKELVERLLGALPFDLLVRAGVKEKLGEYLRADYLDPARNSDHPLHVLDELIESLKGFIAELSSRHLYAKEKLRLIDGMLDYYYVKSYSNSADNRKTMERVSLKYFSETRKRDLRSRYQKEIYNRWKQTFRDNSEFLHREDDFILEIKRNSDQMLNSQEITAILEVDREAYSVFCGHLEADMHLSLDRLAERSFKRVMSKIGREDELIINPRSDDQDDLASVVSQMRDAGRSSETAEWDTVFPIDREFTLGSVLFLRELLFMPIDSLAKWDRLRDYSGSDVKRREASFYSAPKAQSLAALKMDKGQGLTRRQKAIRMMVKEYLPGDQLLALHARVSGSKATDVTDEVIEALARQVAQKDVLALLSDDDLRRVAREFDVIAGIEKARTVKNIEHYLDSL